MKRSNTIHRRICIIVGTHTWNIPPPHPEKKIPCTGACKYTDHYCSDTILQLYDITLRHLYAMMAHKMWLYMFNLYYIIIGIQCHPFSLTVTGEGKVAKLLNGWHHKIRPRMQANNSFGGVPNYLSGVHMCEILRSNENKTRFYPINRGQRCAICTPFTHLSCERCAYCTPFSE